MGVMPLSEYKQYLQHQREQVEKHLSAAIALGRNCPSSLAEAMRYSLLAPGKRLRPLLVILVTEACGGTDAHALPAACAVEMIHTYSLIHDDLPAMDDDDLRRGLPTCHTKFGEALAILAGDALLTLAFEMLAANYAASTAAACCRELARGAGAAGMVGGQVEDLLWEKRELQIANCKLQIANWSSSVEVDPSLEVLQNIHALKTGALFRACLRLGAWVAQGEQPGGPEPRLLDSLDAFGRCFGLAFQITDDLLDVEGNLQQTGKRVQKDAARGKLTYPGLLGVSESRRRAEQLGQEAREHLRPLGQGGERLAALMQLILERDR
jgi:geranylgeranyl diphosphate synthase type II